jgi:hypothetical protein
MAGLPQVQVPGDDERAAPRTTLWRRALYFALSHWDRAVVVAAIVTLIVLISVKVSGLRPLHALMRQAVSACRGQVELTASMLQC